MSNLIYYTISDLLEYLANFVGNMELMLGRILIHDTSKTKFHKGKGRQCINYIDIWRNWVWGFLVYFCESAAYRSECCPAHWTTRQGWFGHKKLQEQSYDYNQLSGSIGSVMTFLSKINRWTNKSVSNGYLLGWNVDSQLYEILFDCNSTLTIWLSKSISYSACFQKMAIFQTGLSITSCYTGRT